MITATEYERLLKRIDELLQVVDNDTPTTDKNFIELNNISDLVADYEDLHYPIKTETPTPKKDVSEKFIKI